MKKKSLNHKCVADTTIILLVISLFVIQDMMSTTTWRRMLITIILLWVLVCTNPGTPGVNSFLDYLSTLKPSSSSTNNTDDEYYECKENEAQKIKWCMRSRRAYTQLNDWLENIFAPHRRPKSPLHTLSNHNFEAIDYAIFTLIRTKNYHRNETDETDETDEQQHAFLGILGVWLPYPDPTRLTGTVELRTSFLLLRILRKKLNLLSSSSLSTTSKILKILPPRPWEWLTVLYVIVGILFLLFPKKSKHLFTLKWPRTDNPNYKWWPTLMLFHLSHGGSILRLFRTIIILNVIAPNLNIQLSSLYGIIFTSSATSTALSMLVLSRRRKYVIIDHTSSIGNNRHSLGNNRQHQSYQELEINGGGSCIYALLIALCLINENQCNINNNIKPFEILMINILFDSCFLAGKKRIADYITHTGATLGSWLYYSVNLS